MEPVAVVIATRNRSMSLRRTLTNLTALPERPQLVVVDNGSADGAPDMVRSCFPGVGVITLGKNIGAAARNVGAEMAAAPYIAFSDDDSWWAPGSLRQAVRLFEQHARMALLAARIVVGAEARLDPTCRAMASSPLPIEPDLPGRSVLGFVACGSVVRRSAYLACGGFEPRFGIGGEEGLLALDLASSGWGLAYVDSVVAHHHPSPLRDPVRRRRGQLRNAFWTAWLRRSWPSTLSTTFDLLREAAASPELWPVIPEAALGLPWTLRRRRVVPFDVEQRSRALTAGD